MKNNLYLFKKMNQKNIPTSRSIVSFLNALNAYTKAILAFTCTIAQNNLIVVALEVKELVVRSAIATKASNTMRESVAINAKPRWLYLLSWIGKVIVIGRWVMENTSHHKLVLRSAIWWNEPYIAYTSFTLFLTWVSEYSLRSTPFFGHEKYKK